MSEELRVVRIDLGQDGPIREELENRTTVILLHGFGATPQDLVPLADEIGTFRHWWFPGAPYPITVSGMRYGRAWFPRDDGMMQRALYGSYFTDVREMEPPGLTESAREIVRLVDGAGLPPDSVILGGFSQGAMVSAEYGRLCLLEGRPLPKALLLLSGALLGERLWRRLIEGTGAPLEVTGRTERSPLKRRGADSAVRCPVFQSHGRADTVLPFQEGEALRDVLGNAGFSVDFHEFSGGHEIPSTVVAALARFLSELM